jgi:hypothetical protein
MISLPNCNSSIMTELTQENYCDQQPVTMEFTFEEHDFLNDILCHASDGIFVAYPNFHELPEDSEICQRFKMLEQMRHKSNQLWKNRFGN